MKLIDRLIASLRVIMVAPDGIATPAAILWTDADGQWLPLFQRCAPYSPGLRPGPL